MQRLTLIAGLTIVLATWATAVGQPLSTAPDSDSPTAKHTEFIARLKSNIFKVRAETASKDVFATGTAFLVDDKGTAITNFHVIQGAAGASAEVATTKETIRIELVAVEPTVDLALIRVVEPKRLGAGSGLTIGHERPIEGATVWAAGFPKGFGFSVSRGVVNGIRQYGELPENIRKQLNYGESSEWIQTDATITERCVNA